MARLPSMYGHPAQLDGFGLDVQERAVRTWSRTHGHHIIAVHTDAGVSGAADRPGLSALLDYAREGDTVVVVA
ncbi:MAG: recombinase family protein, partial [Actinobacteria bacterium]|nr:recombinase family protein [Actinomycetota bacterium]